MANTESIREIAHSRTPLSTWFGVVLLFVFFGVLVLAVIGPMPRGSDYEETRAKKRLEKLKTVHEEAEKALSTYAWIDKNKGVTQIPISRAMELTVAELARQKPQPAGPIVAPQEQAAPAPGAPAPAASPKAGAAQPAASPEAPASAASASPAAQTSPAPAASGAPTSATPAHTP